MGTRSRRRRAGLTLLEAAIVVSLIGVVPAVFVPTFLSAIRTSKVSEASEELGRIHALAAAYFEAPQTRSRRRRCLPTAAGPAPSEPSMEASHFDFQADDARGAETWRALSYQPARPVRYRYTFAPAASACGLETPADGPLVTLRAEGDLDGDGKRSVFEREATVDRDGSLVPTGVLYMLDRVE